MRVFAAALAFAVVPGFLIAQQPDAYQASAADAAQQIDYHCDKDEILYKHCKAAEQHDKEAAAQRAVQKEDAKRKSAPSNFPKIRLSDKDDQIDAVVGESKDENSHGNTNRLSKELTDKSLSLIDQMAHQENRLLDSIDKSVQDKPASPSHSGATVGADGHMLNGSTGAEVHPLTLQQQFHQESLTQQLPGRVHGQGNSEENSHTTSFAKSITQRTLLSSVQSREAFLLNSPAAITSVAAAVQKAQAAERLRQQQLAREQAAKDAAYLQALRLAAEKAQAAQTSSDRPCSYHGDLPETRPECLQPTQGNTGARITH